MQGCFSVVQRRTTYLVSRKKVQLAIVVSIMLLICISTIGNLPVHRTDIVHADTYGDTLNPDFDIIQVRSFARPQYIVLELTVAGMIQTEESEALYSDFLYRIIVVAKGIDDNSAHIYACTFRNGFVQQYGFDSEIENATLRIFFPWTAFVHNSYMIGLEGTALSGLDKDYTASDRNSDIACLLF